MTKKKEYSDYFVDHMMVQELGQVVPDASDSPVKNGVITFISFMIFGFVPLLAYIIFYGAKYNDAGGQIGICAAVTLATLFGLG
jgi:VIT1/CCC1 family predicted Fe2+/Mn2+ transporter